MGRISIRSFLIKNILNVDSSYNEAEIEKLTVKLKRTEFKKHELLVRAGTISKHSFFVEQGLLRYYSIDDKGREHILHFAPEGWLVSDRESFFFKKPSNYYIEALEDSIVVLLEPYFFSQIVSDSQKITHLNELLLQKHILQLQKRITQLLSASAEERYLNFMKIYPDIVMRVPQWMVASYLGIAPESLSRVRKDLATKWKNKEKNEPTRK